MANIVKMLVGVLLAALIVVAVKIGYDKYNERYTVTTDQGFAVAQVVAAKLFDASDLRVSELKGTVQGVAVDARFFDLLKSERVMKAPFKVGYFVDVSQLRPGDFRFDGDTRTLFVNAPAVRIEHPDIDETRISLDRTNGWFVTREAMIVLQRRASASADRVAAEVARKPENVTPAKENARRALAALFAGSLRAAKIEATVIVRFADEPRSSAEQMDRSRSIEEVLANSG